MNSQHNNRWLFWTRQEVLRISIDRVFLRPSSAASRKRISLWRDHSLHAEAPITCGCPRLIRLGCRSACHPTEGQAENQRHSHPRHKKHDKCCNHNHSYYSQPFPRNLSLRSTDFAQYASFLESAPARVRHEMRFRMHALVSLAPFPVLSRRTQSREAGAVP